MIVIDWWDTQAAGTEHDAAYTPNNLHQYLSLTYGGTAYSRSHSNAGNLLDENTSDLTKYAWDYNDKLAARWCDTDDDGEVDGTETIEYEYTYDAEGRRVLKKVGSTDTRYIYNGWQCIEEYVDTGSGFALKADYVYGNNIDEVLQMRRDLNGDGDFLDANEVVYYHTNVQGNVIAVSDLHGHVIEKIEYDLYGRMTGGGVWNDQTEVFDPITQSGDFLTATEYYAGSLAKNPLLFQGRRLDEESGLYYFRNRQYDPVHGRFLSRDPLGYVDSMCLYSFVNNSPICHLDLYGKYVQAANAVIWDEAKEILKTMIEKYRTEQNKGSIDDLGVWETMDYIGKEEFKGRYICLSPLSRPLFV